MILKKIINNSITAVIVIAIASSMLVGCGTDGSGIAGGIKSIAEYFDNKGWNKKNTGTITVYGMDGTEISSTETVINMFEDDDNTSDEISAAELVSKNESLLKNNSYCYMYSMLNEEEQKVYNEIYVVLEGLEKNAELSTVNRDIVELGLKCVLADHPEIFYVSGYNVSEYIRFNEIKKIVFSGKYTMNKSQVEQKKPLIEAYINKVQSGVDPSASEYEKIKYVYEYLINNNEYDMDSENNQNILSVVENGVTVCQGYAKMTQLLLNRMGVFCTIAGGKAKSGPFQEKDGTIYDNTEKIDDYNAADDSSESEDGWGAHVWNVVKADGEYYNVDTTWGDASFIFVDQDSDEYMDGPELNYDFLMLPDSMIESTHRCEPFVEMPVCSSMEDNYYVKEGYYFTGVDEKQIKSAIEKAYSDGLMYVTFKCSDKDCYKELRDYLFKKEKIFKYLPEAPSISYIEYSGRCALTIYL